jgi:2-polyprenyl-3-methyl-5-hydroxy-6-metoxy-1,4-benzoquinol methylase
MLITSCALCGSANLALILDLGFHPLADSFLKKEELLQPEATYPLQVLMCESCGHAMNSYVVPPTARYQDHDYSYDSSNSRVSIEHFKEMARDVAERVGVTGGDLVVDIGSSVGTLLQAFKDQTGANILGVEPAHNIAALAGKNNIPTINDFWNDAAVVEVLKVGKAKAITITNAFNHISDLDDFMRNIVRTLAPDGALVIEAPYLLHLVQKLAFDTIYLEHVSYLAIKPLVQYFKKFGMVITDILLNDYMGGSMRLYVRFGTQQSPAVEANIERENAAHLYDLTTYTDLSTRMRQFKYTLVKQLLDARLRGGTIIGIGAPAKGNTLLNYCGIDSTLLDFITDASPLKVGKYTPGSHIPILPDEAITTMVTHALILPWNIAEFLKGKLAPKYPRISFITPHMQ